LDARRWSRPAARRAQTRVHGEILAFAEVIRSGKLSPAPIEPTISVIAILQAIVQSS